MKFYKIKKKTKIMLVKLIVDAVVKFAGVACFFIGIGGMAECPTDPKKIIQALAMFLFGLAVIAYNSYLVSRQERTQK